MFTLIGLVCSSWAWGQGLYLSPAGHVHFTSEAPLELIEAQSNKLNCIIDATHRTFAFSLEIRSFDGFNSALQREHFNENYMESHKHPEATFNGKILDNVDLSKPGTYEVQAKGTFTVHGVSIEKVFKSQVVSSAEGLAISSEFSVPLAEHNITVPKIVNQKIASVILVKINAQLKPKK